MRRPPTNLDDFLQGSEGLPEPEPNPPKTSQKQVPKKSTPARSESSPKQVPKKSTPARSESSKDETVAIRLGSDSRAKKAAAKKTQSSNGKKQKTSSSANSPSASPGSTAHQKKTAAAPKTRRTPRNMQEPAGSSDRQRARTVPGEAAATVIMSVRVPIELRERLEDILAAYSGVTFSDLVIRGLQTMVNEVEESHLDRTGQELPQRETRPEFPL